MGEDLLTQVDSDERWTRVCERLREIMSVCVCLRGLGGLSGAGFAGFIGIFRMGEDLLTQVGSDERWTRVCERLREIMSVCVCLRVLGGLSGAGFAGFIGIFRMGEDLLTQVRSDERWTRVCERLREIMSVCECLRVLGGLSGAGFAGFIGIFRMGEDLLTQVGSYERLREFASVRDHERLRVFTCVGRIVWSRICRIYWDFQDGGGTRRHWCARTSVGREFESVYERS